MKNKLDKETIKHPETGMVICKAGPPSMRAKLGDGVIRHKQIVNLVNPQHKVRTAAWPYLKSTHHLHNYRMDQKTSPVCQRRSFKYIERNIVQRRTRNFEGEAPSNGAVENGHKDTSDKESSPKRLLPSYKELSPKRSSSEDRESSPKRSLPMQGKDKENISILRNPERVSSTIAERAKLFRDEQKESDARESPTRLQEARVSKSLEKKPPVSPKKPSLAKKPSVNLDKMSEADEALTVEAKKPAKPERPPVPSPRNSIAQKPESSPDNISDNGKTEVPKEIPQYAKVKKPKKSVNEESSVRPHSYDGVVIVPETETEGPKKVFLENITLKPVGEKAAEKVVSSASIQPGANVAASASVAANTPNPPGADVAASAPPKPPRTFAHDEYMATKLARKKDHRAARIHSCPSPVQEFVRPSHIYEEIDEVRKEQYDESQKPVVYELVKDIDDETKVDRLSVNRRVQTNSSGYSYASVCIEEDNKMKPTRPAPPPRPPQPSVKIKQASQNSRFDSPMVHINKHSSQLDSRDTVRKKHINNPAYEKQPDFIPIKTFRSPTGEMKRYKSDECLYSEVKDDFADESPIYSDPVDVMKQHRSASTHVQPGTIPAMDDEGYAIPDTRRHTYHRQTSAGPWHPSVNKFSTLQHSRSPTEPPGRFSRNWGQMSIRRRTAREKVSRAYSVLRKRPVPDGTMEATQPASEEDDRDSEVDLEEHQKRLQHISSLKEKTHNSVNWTMSMKKVRFAKLFHYSLVVGLTKVEDQNIYKPYIIASFPIKEKEQVESILNFCFPDADSWRPVTHYNSESYCFVLTNEDGSRQYGYCRRILPPGDANRLPEVYCVISPIGAFNLYEQLMQKVESLRQQSQEHASSLLKSAFSRTFPDPGQEAWINLRLQDKRETVILKRSQDERLESISFAPLLSRLSIDNLLKVYASLLLERRVIFTAQHLGTLSSCIQGIVSLLYPYSWQHVYIPVLPGAMLDFCCSPTPFIIGILSTSVPQLQHLPLNEVLIVDLENNSLLHGQGDEHTIIPRKIQRALVASLKDDSDVQGTKDTVVFEAFLRLFIETMGHYSDCISMQQDGQNVFQKDIFCRAVSSRSIRLFLEWFTETQMFEVFITERLERGIPDGYYERRVTEYREEMAAETNKFKDNVKELGRKMINFVRESGGKIKKALAGSSHVYV